MLSKIFGLAAFLISTATAAAGSQPGQFSVAGVGFSAPPGWSVEPINQGVLLMAPLPERNWQANIFVEPRIDHENRPLENALDDLVPNLKARKAGFKEIARTLKKTRSGLTYAVLEYSHHSQGANLREWEVVVGLPGTTRVFVMCSSEESLVGKYQSVFDGFLEAMGSG